MMIGDHNDKSHGIMFTLLWSIPLGLLMWGAVVFFIYVLIVILPPLHFSNDPLHLDGVVPPLQYFPPEG